MDHGKINKRKLVASLLTVCFLAHQTMALNVMASTITGVQNNNGVFNITPGAVNGTTGFRQYKDFNLSEGDIANLIFKYGAKNLERFVNLVDNQININGIVNSMRDGNFYNGQAVFVSPNGMVVGASGVLNVGSLAVYTPNSDDFKNYKKHYLTQDLAMVKEGTSNVTINGKVISRGDVEVLAKTATIGANAGIISGVKGNTDVFNSAAQANALFSQLVNTEATSGNQFAAENGNIVIKTSNGIEVNGAVKNMANSGNVELTNGSAGGIKIASAAKVQNAGDNTILTNAGSQGIKVNGKVTGNNIKVKNSNSDVVIGDASVNNNLDARNNININLENGNLLNAGYDKTLLKAGNNLNIDVKNGKIGTFHNDGVGPDARDLTKSVNINVQGKVNATTTDTKNSGNNLSINMASKDSNMNVDSIIADGQVALLADSSTKGQTPYSILNASSDSSKANVQGTGVSLIASGNIGDKNNKLTFNQTDADNYEFNALAINDINVKGHSDAYSETNVNTMIAKNGSINAEFAGNVNVKETTAAKDLNITTRGAELNIENLGSVPNTPVDYYGPNSNVKPKNVELKALDINKNTRVDKNWADSIVKVENGSLQDGGEMTITADNIYADGVYISLGKDNYGTRVADDSTNEIEGED